MPDATSRTCRTTTLRLILAGTLSALVGLSGGLTAHAAEGGESTTTVDGTTWTVYVDERHDHEEEVEASGAGEVETVTVLEVDGEVYDLGTDSVLDEVPSGSEVSLTLEVAAGSDESDAVLALADPAVAPDVLLDVEVLEPVTPEAAASDPSTMAAVTGTRTLTVLPVHFGTPDPRATTSVLNSLAASTAGYWREQSGGRLSIQPSVRAWKAIGSVVGCDYASIMSRALDAHGVDVTSAQQHVLVYFPELTACAWAGLGSVGGPFIWVNGELSEDVFAHELGHNLGLGHANNVTCTSGGSPVPLVRAGLFSSACAVREYADLADVMGASFVDRASGNLNTGLADHLGYVRVKRVSATATSPVTVDLAPLASTGAVRSLAVTVPNGVLYVDFRPATGRDVRVPRWAGVQVHLRRTDRTGAPETFLLDMQPAASYPFAAANMRAGQSWRIPDTGLTLTVVQVGSTARVTVGPAVTDQKVERYVTRVYRDLFGRTPDPQGLETWSSALRGGAPRGSVANAITSSEEYRSGLIRGSYSRYLGRSADAAGLRFWLGEMSRGRTIQQMEGGFLASQEYYLQAGSTRAGWVRALYRDVLGRSPSAAEVRHWTGEMVRGASRSSVALGFLLSTEHLTVVVDGYYRDLLGRGLDATGRRFWVAAIQRGTRTEAIIGGIISSDEYFARA